MSSSLIWRPAPVDPPALGSSGHPLKGTLFAALEQAAGIMNPEQHLRESGHTVHRFDAVHVWLQGYLTALQVSDPEAAVLRGMLADLDNRGSLLLEVRS